MDVHIDKAGKNEQSLGVVTWHFRSDASGIDVDSRDFTVDNEKVCDSVEILRRIDDSPVFNENRL